MTCSSGCSSCSAALQGFSCIDTVFGDCISGEPPKAVLAAFDRVALNKWLAVPVFALIMAAVFAITFGPLVGKASDFVDWLVNVQLLESVRGLLSSAGAPAWITGLLADGAIGGAGAVLIFLPQITVLFFLLSLLEGTGYMARAAFVMDRALSWLGLSGRSFVTLIMGFGCTVPSIMASRILEEEEERKIAVIVAPFISCSARMPIYVLIAGAFFGAKAGLAAASMYFLGIAVMIASAFLLSRTVFKSRSSSAFVLEMPPYRIPRLSYLAMATWHKTKDFIVRAGTLIVLVSVGLWVLSNLSFSLKAVTDPSQSMLAAIGKMITPLISPLGLGEWRISVALLSGIAAKEIVASTIRLLAGTGPDALASLGLNAASALAFMAFSLLYVPCTATIVVMRRELGSARQTALAVLYGIAVAWLVSFAIYRIASLFI
jgi:ferrous iron transport protein B